MDLPLNAEVRCTDGVAGHSTCIMLNPTTSEITHFVVQTKGLLGIEFLVPVGEIGESAPHCIQLRCTLHQLFLMEPFLRAEYSNFYSLPGMYGPGEFLPWPYMMNADEPDTLPVDDEQIPLNELGIHRGAHVDATDGRVGRLDEFLLNQANHQITHLVLREGHLWGQKEVIIPVAAIARIEEDVVYLKLDKQSVKSLPAIPVP